MIIKKVVIYLPCHTIWNLSQNTLHHGQMLTIVMGLEESNAQIQLKEDTTVDKNDKFSVLMF